MKLRIFMFAAVVLMAALPGLVLAQSEPQPKNGDDHAVLEDLRPALQKRTGVPLRLPTFFDTGEEEYRLYASVISAMRMSYEVELAFVPDCGTATACHYGSVTGKQRKSNARAPRGMAVKLAHNITGYFVDAKCGASCGDSTLTWDQSSHRYSVSLKAGRSRSLIKMANSALNNTP